MVMTFWSTQGNWSTQAKHVLVVSRHRRRNRSTCNAGTWAKMSREHFVSRVWRLILPPRDPLFRQSPRTNSCGTIRGICTDVWLVQAVVSSWVGCSQGWITEGFDQLNVCVSRLEATVFASSNVHKCCQSERSVTHCLSDREALMAVRQHVVIFLRVRFGCLRLSVSPS